MTERRPPPRPLADRRPSSPALGARGVESGEFRRPGPRRFPTVEMSAVAPPQSSGRMLDDSLDFDVDLEADGGLDLDCLPSSHRPRVEQPRQSSFEPTSASRSTPNGPPSGRNGGPPLSGRNGGPPPSGRNGGPPPSRPGAAPPPSRPNGNATTRGLPAANAGRTASQPAIDTHAAILAFAGFGATPTSILKMPSYAFHVLARKRTLKAELERARQRGSHDVGLYEASLRTADDAAVRTGIIVVAMLVTLALLLTATLVQVFVTPLPFLR